MTAPVRALAAVIMFTVVALAASACGSEDEQPASTADWADSVCVSLSEWTTELQSIAGELVASPSSLSVESVGDALADAKTATETMRDDVRELGAPPLPNGEEARDVVDETLDTVQDHVDQAREAAGSDSASLSELLGRLTSVVGELEAAGAAIKELVGEVATIAPELEDAFSESDACSELG